MKPPSRWSIAALRWGGIAAGVLALAILAFAVSQHYQVNFWEWPRQVKWGVAAALALLLAASRMRFIASRLEARAMVTAKPENAEAPLNPRLRIYEDGAPSRPSAAPTAPEPDFAVQLRKLHELKEAGIITDAEFEVKKAAILEKI